MPRILVSPEELRSVAAQLRRGGGDLREMRGRLRLSAHEADWQSASYTAMAGRFHNAERMADHLAEMANELAAFLSESARRFEEADRESSGGLTETSRVLGEVVRQLVRYTTLAGVAGLPVAIVDFWLQQGALLGPGRLYFPGVTQTSPVDEVLRRWAPGSARSGPGKPVQAEALGLMILGRLLLGGPAGTVYERKTGVDGLSLLHLESDGTTHTFNGARYAVETDLLGARLSGSLSAGNIEAHTTLLNSSMKVSILEARGEARLVGTDMVNVGAEATGRAGVAAAGYNFDIAKGQLELEAYAGLLEGDAAFKLHVFNWDVKLGVSGCAACVGGSFKGGATEGEVKLAGILGLGIKWDVDPAKKH